MAKKTIHIMNTAFRDGFQSVYGARVLTEDFLPLRPVLKQDKPTLKQAAVPAFRHRSFIAMSLPLT